MATLTTTKTETRTVTGANVREVAGSTWQEVIAIGEFYGRHFPYDMAKLRNDLGQILLWDMAEKIVVQFYEISGSERIERLSYEFVPLAAGPQAVQSPPGEFPRFEISPSWQVRLVARYTTRKPENEVREFYEALGWRPSEPLTRSGQGSTTTYGAFRSGDFSVSRDVYTDLPDTNNQTARKEREL
jgi:hypothetical protein